MSMESVSSAARVASSDEGISADELQLAARNHGLPLEALRYDVTPVGLHYLLTHYDIPFVDPRSWRLFVHGAVEHPMILSLEALQDRARTSETVTLECAGNGRARLVPRPVSQPWLNEAVGTATWTGARLADLLHEAGIADDATEVVFTGLDHGIERGVEQDYARSLPITEATRPDVLLAYEMNGAPLTPQHGYPLRLILPGWYGMAQVKWLHHIVVAREPFQGYQQAEAYRIIREGEERGEPVTRIRPRALMIPPGFPDFLSRTRIIDMGEHLLEGRAWSGTPPVVQVEVSTDAGETWATADLDPPTNDWAWQRWTYLWRADRPGTYELCVRAHDVAGHAQPSVPEWNRQGMANNQAQRVPVVVRG